MEQKSIYKIVKDHDNIILEPIGGHKTTLIWMHGLGDKPDSFIEFFSGKHLLTPPVRNSIINSLYRT